MEVLASLKISSVRRDYTGAAKSNRQLLVQVQSKADLNTLYRLLPSGNSVCLSVCLYSPTSSRSPADIARQLSNGCIYTGVVLAWMFVFRACKQQSPASDSETLRFGILENSERKQDAVFLTFPILWQLPAISQQPCVVPKVCKRAAGPAPEYRVFDTRFSSCGRKWRATVELASFIHAFVWFFFFKVSCRYKLRYSK